MFRIDVQNLSWVQGGLACEDYCAHGHVTAWIGQEVFADDCTVSSTALYLLKSLTEDHIIYEGQQMLPCCGHTMIARENGRLDTVDIDVYKRQVQSTEDGVQRLALQAFRRLL